MLTTILTAATLAFAPTATVCNIDTHGNANQCASYDSAGGLNGGLEPRQTLTWNGRRFLNNPRVNGRKGQWNFDHTLLTWQHRKVTFDGVSFVNYGRRVITVSTTL